MHDNRELCHENRPCVECRRLREMNAERAQDDLMSRKVIDNNTQECPRCKVRVYRNGGCNHMTCTCGMQFCFTCGGNYSPGTEAPTTPREIQDMTETNTFPCNSSVCYNYPGTYCSACGQTKDLCANSYYSDCGLMEENQGRPGIRVRVWDGSS